MAEFTPGPWERDGTTIYADSYKGEHNIHGAVAHTICSEGEIPFQEIANARLIAAAPDLYEALDDLIMAIELPGDHCELAPAMERARAALAKAKGEVQG